MVEVALSPADLANQDLAGRAVFVIDILRATTTIAAALHHGATTVIPVSTPEAARQVALGFPDAVLAGERDCLRIPGFDAGNSPLEMRPRAVGGHPVVLCTTNGTGAFATVGAAAHVYSLAAVNFTVSVVRARALLEESGDLLVACAGREGGFGLDDAYTAGRLILGALDGQKPRQGANDSALVCIDLARRYSTWLRPLLAARAGRELVRLGFRDDVVLAATQDRYPVLPQFSERRITVRAA